MQLYTTIPIEIKITSYIPGDPGRISGPPELCYPPESPEIEFEIYTLTGTELSESDFGKEAWEELYGEVLASLESAVEEAEIDAAEDEDRYEREFRW